MELVHRATVIKDSLQASLAQLENSLVIIPQEESSLLDIFTTNYSEESKPPASQSSLVTLVWAHAALIYLSVVVSGWQPASVDVRYHVGWIVELLTRQISPPTLLRTMVWPFCVAGCLAELAQEAHLRAVAKALQPQASSARYTRHLRLWRMYGAIGTLEMRRTATSLRALEAKVIWCYLYRGAVAKDNECENAGFGPWK